MAEIKNNENDSWHTGLWSEEWAKKPRIGMNKRPIEKPYERQEYPKVVGETTVNSAEEEAALVEKTTAEAEKSKSKKKAE